MSSGSDGPPKMRELKVEDALLYLDQVKLEFGDRPRVYNEFLEIMKGFKATEIDTPGVIARVSTLFRGCNKLILGFNTFLPEGYKIELKDLEGPDAVYGIHAQKPLPGTQGPVSTVTTSGGMPSAPPQNQHIPQVNISRSTSIGSTGSGVVVGQAHQQQAPHQQQQYQPSAGRRWQTGAPPQESAQATTSNTSSQQTPTVEFDHAITYVTTIKKRFAHDPATYHSFLEILHTYQKEQRGIKEVLEQVAELFADHPDLLKEFIYFLPDAVQDQAKKRLHSAAALSEARLRQRSLLQNGAESSQSSYMQHRGSSYGKGGRKSDKGMNDYHRQAAQVKNQVQMLQQQQLQQQQLHGKTFVDMTAPAQTTSSKLEKMKASNQQPENYVYNNAVERQFFDAVKESLTTSSRDGNAAWTEFLRCLDLYSQEILPRDEMLKLIENLLGKRNSSLIEEFKRILNAIGAPLGSVNNPTSDDTWYSVPLADIDFGRCRQCTPSYRALPRDYPLPPCTARNDVDSKVLNDNWVSLPVGSEDSYTFRHMRRNQYEESLFKCEDEQFEIDMVIESNTSTMRKLEPVVKEIAVLKQTMKDNGKRSTKGFQYKLENNFLSTIHRHSISRIYGDSSSDMIDLLYKNPMQVVPLVYKRLKQKDAEWREAKQDLLERWRDLTSSNYHKALDHMSLSWRAADRRACSTRALLAEIRDRAANGGSEGKEAFALRKEKLKEECGAYIEVTREIKPIKIDLTGLPVPSSTLFTPHLCLPFNENNYVLLDAYRILSFAIERGNPAPPDKERAHRIWRDFLGPFFGLSIQSMYSSSLLNQEILSDDDEAVDDEDSDEIMDNHTSKDSKANYLAFWEYYNIPKGALVSTEYGDGTIVSFDSKQKHYVVKLDYGLAHLQPTSILCSLLPVEESLNTNNLWHNDKESVPLDCPVVLGTQCLYLFVRLFQTLIARLNVARRLCFEKTKSYAPTSVEWSAKEKYEEFLNVLYAFIDSVGTSYNNSGSAAEMSRYEERVRHLLGHEAYELLTMEKLVNHLVKNLQNMGNDETLHHLLQVYRRHRTRGSFKPSAYRQEAISISGNETVFAFQYMPTSKMNEKVMFVEYLGCLDEEDNDDADDERDEKILEEDVASNPDTNHSRSGDESLSAENNSKPSSKRQRR